MNPNNYPYSTEIITLSATGTFIAEDMNIDRASKAIRRFVAPIKVLKKKKFSARFAGQAIVDGPVTGGATLQLPTAGTVLPAIGETFCRTNPKETFTITSVGKIKKNHGLSTCKISFSRNTP